jgi:hypothetical protein
MAITNEASVEKGFASLSRVDPVVFSAGILRNGAIVRNDLENQHRIVDERPCGPRPVVWHAAPWMAQGPITFTSGSLPPQPCPGKAMLTSMLAGQEPLAPTLALELAPVRVSIEFIQKIRS